MASIGNVSELGEFIRCERKKQGLTQTKLAHYACVGLNFVSQLENGKETAEVGKVLRVLQTLGTDLEVTPREES